MTLTENLALLAHIRQFQNGWNGYDAESFPPELLDFVVDLIRDLPVQPNISPTPQASIQLEYTNSDKDYLEFEIFADKTIKLFYMPYNGKILLNEKIDKNTLKKQVEGFFGNQKRCSKVKENLEKKIQKIFRKYNYQPIAICGEWDCFPKEFMCFRNTFRLAGRCVYLSNSDILATNFVPDDDQENREESEEKCEAHDKLHALLHKFDDGNYAEKETLMKEIVSAYYSALSQELKYGLVRLPYTSQHLSSDTKVKSRHGDYMINYSPSVLELERVNGENVLEKMSERFARAYVDNIPCLLMKVYFDRSVEEGEVAKIGEMMTEVVKEINKFQKKEYMKEKDNEEYQHRDDWDPASF